MFEQFMQNHEQLFGKTSMVTNIHTLKHLTEDYIKYGPLDNCLGFPFETYLFKIKNILRTYNNPLAQIVRRISELRSMKTAWKPRNSNFSFSQPHANGPIVADVNEVRQFRKAEFFGLFTISVFWLLASKLNLQPAQGNICQTVIDFVERQPIHVFEDTCKNATQKH